MRDDLELFAAGHLDKDHLDKLADLGSKGVHSNNVWSQLKNMLPTPKLPPLQMIHLPIKHTTLGKIWAWVPMLLPHVLFAAIYEHYPVMWQKIVYGSAERCKEFWHAVKGSPQFHAHKVKDREDYTTKCIPLKIHGDGTPVTGLGKGWGKLVDIYSVSSLLICGPTILRNPMMFFMFAHLICRDADHCTLDRAFKELKWSFKCCWDGKKPKFDSDGNPMFYEGAGEDLCGGYFFAVWALICDLEHARENYDLPNPTATACCGLCPVGLLDGVHWWDFRPNAVWLNLVYTIESWLARGLTITYYSTAYGGL
jgi:hypothetical protein